MQRYPDANAASGEELILGVRNDRIYIPDCADLLIR